MFDYDIYNKQYILCIKDKNGYLQNNPYYFAKMLGINIDKLIEINNYYNGKFLHRNDFPYNASFIFDNVFEIINCIDFLNSILVMNKLTK